jgi:hypothetical protein
MSSNGTYFAYKKTNQNCKEFEAPRKGCDESAIKKDFPGTSDKRQFKWKRGIKIIAGSAVTKSRVDGTKDGLNE